MVENQLTQRASKAKMPPQDQGSWLMPKIGKIYRERGNRWYIRLPGGIQIHCDKNHLTFHSKDHAQATLIKIAAEIENGTFDANFYAKSKKSLLSFSVYALEWLAGCEKREERDELSLAYLKDLQRFIHKIFIPYFQQTNILDIKGRELKAFFLSLNYHAKTVYNIMAALHKIFKDAVYEEVIPAMPNFPKQGRIPEPDWNWAYEDVQDHILGQLEQDDLYAIFFLMSHGCRPGELRALKHKDLDLKADKVTIRRSFSRTKLVETTKSKRRRTIDLDETWKEMYLARPRAIDPEAFIFNKNGKPLSATWLTKQWRKACDKAGVDGLTLYDGTRHSLASQLANRDVNLYKIGKLLGHSTMKMTERYSHLDSKSSKELSRKNKPIPIFSLKQSKQ
jgi:integrase